MGKFKKMLFPVIAVLAVVILGYMVWSLTGSNQNLQHGIEAAAKQTAELKQGNQKLTAQLDRLKGQLTGYQQQVSSLTQNGSALNDQLAAFARQAAACDRVKKQLNIKD